MEKREEEKREKSEMRRNGRNGGKNMEGNVVLHFYP